MIRKVSIIIGGALLLSLLGGIRFSKPVSAATDIPIDQPLAYKGSGTGEYPTAVGARCVDVDYGIVESGQARHANTDGPIFVTPSNPDGPVIVDIGLYVMGITEVDVNSSSYSMEGFLDLIWCDPRWSYDSADTQTEYELFLEHDAEQQLDQMWWPDIELVNGIRQREIENEELLIYPDGTVEYREKFFATLSTNFEMRAFPFDQQTLLIEIESFAWASDTLEFHVEEAIVGFSNEFQILEWEVVGIEEYLTTKQEVRDRSPYSEFVAAIMIDRDPGFYISKVILPLSLVSLIVTIVFWMPVDDFENRGEIGITGVLTAVAYQFVVGQDLPRHVYNTFLDGVITWTFFAIVLTIVESLVVFRIHQAGQNARAEKIDVLMRWMFPLIYFIVIGLLYLAYV